MNSWKRVVVVAILLLGAGAGIIIRMVGRSNAEDFGQPVAPPPIFLPKPDWKPGQPGPPAPPAKPVVVRGKITWR